MNEQSMSNRRKFLKTFGFSLAAVSAGAYFVPFILQDKNTRLKNSTLLNSKQQSILFLLGRVILPSTLKDEDIIQNIEQIESFVMTLPVHKKAQFFELLSVFDSNLYVRLLTQTPLKINNQKDAKQFLDQWRQGLNHMVLGHQQYIGYKSICDLFFTSFYSSQLGHQLTGYKSL